MGQHVPARMQPGPHDLRSSSLVHEQRILLLALRAGSALRVLIVTADASVDRRLHAQGPVDADRR